MTSFLSLVGPRSPEFGTNAEAMRAWVAELRLKLEDVAGGGGEASRAGHTSRGKMMPTLLLCPRRRSCQSSAAPDHESGLDILGRRASCNATVPLRCNGSAQENL